ncbi:mediator complex, subunit Med18 [Nemania sp. NC0429]|nr:mediator complex, subunit Med18 [Nemania sp. NC0429]
MHELFLTASVSQSDFDTACAVLQGLCWMTARRTVYRVLFFAGQPQPRGLPTAPPPTALPRQPQERQLWAELGRQLLRSSYVLQAAYEVSPETDFGRDANKENGDSSSPSMDFNRLPATLRWTDLPDPLREAPKPKAARKKNSGNNNDLPDPVHDSPITSRKKIDVSFLHSLPRVLTENKHTYTNELIQETYSFTRGDLEIALSRYYHLPSTATAPSSAAGAAGVGRRPAAHLPAWADLRPVDSAQKWVLTVKLHVAEDGQPDKLAKAHEELTRSKAEFDKLFDFRPVDRRVFDTRIAPPPVVPGRGPS